MIDPDREKRKIKTLVALGVLLWFMGFAMVLSVVYLEMWGPYANIPDSAPSRTLMSLNLGGIAFILSGMFMVLLTIAKVLGIMPVALGVILGKFNGKK